VKDNPEKAKILIVDDTPENIQILMETLKSDYKIVAAVNGQKALELAEKHPVPDLILLDIMMPGMNGYEVCSRLKAQKATSKIPVIFVTAMGDVDDEARGFSLGAVDYITKPITPGIVRARVKTHLGLKNAQQKLQALLNETLSGSIRVLIDILSLARPVAFKRSSQIRNLVKEMAERLGLNDIWRYELAALLSQIGCITMSNETLKKVNAGKELTDEEERTYLEYPVRGAEMISHIPNLETVADIISGFMDDPGTENEFAPDAGDGVLIGRQLLRIAADYIHLTNSGETSQSVISRMNARYESYDADIVNVLRQILGLSEPKKSAIRVGAEQLAPGMILDQDVYSKDGSLLAVTETVLSPTVAKLLNEYGRTGQIENPVRVFEAAG
jgi:putative two-component system response regulator